MVLLRLPLFAALGLACLASSVLLAKSTADPKLEVLDRVYQ